MKRMNGRFVLLIPLLVGVFLLSSCGDSENNNNEVDVNASATIEATEVMMITETPTQDAATQATAEAKAQDELVSALLFDYENFLQANDVASALDSLAKALEIYPQNRDLLFLRATLLFETLQFEQALDDVDVILAENENDVEAMNLAGNIYFSMNEYAMAEEMFEGVIATDADYLDAYLQLGFLYYAQGELEQAVAAFSDYVDLAEDSEDRNYILDFIETIEANMTTEDSVSDGE